MTASPPVPAPAPPGARPSFHLLLPSLFVAGGLAACLSSGAGEPAPPVLAGPGAEAFAHERVPLPVVRDPFEPTHRRTAAFNEGLIEVASPLLAGWRAVVPAGPRRGVRNVFHNLAWPVRLVSNLVQGKGSGALAETERFVVNSTFGVGGLFDMARDSIPPSDEDLGEALAAAGWDDPQFLVLPVLGPSTTRDAVGALGNSIVDPATYVPWATVVREGNAMSDRIERLRRLSKTLYDPYALARLYTVLLRDDLARDDLHGREPCEECVGQQTIQAIFLTYHDPRFPRTARTRSVLVPATGRELEYSLFLQEAPAPVVYILPGLGGHRLSDSALALAEMVYRHGLSAVVISSVMNFEFIANASSVPLPGYAPVDVRDVAAVLSAIDADLTRAFPGRATGRMLLGVSLGAFHALYLAGLEATGDPAALSFDRYVAIDPPVSLETGARRIDAYYEAPLSLPPAERARMVRHTLSKAVAFGAGTLEPTGAVPFSELESRFLIGLSFRWTLRDVIHQTQLRSNQGVLRAKLDPYDRAAAYAEIEQYSFLGYFYAFLLPTFARRDPTLTLDEAGAIRFFAREDLRSLEEPLAASGKVELFMNRDDFLLSAEDRAWLGATFGESRCHHFATGGHMGNLYRPSVQEAILGALGSAGSAAGGGASLRSE